MRKSTILCLGATAALLAAAPCQERYGVGAPGSGGITPRLSCQQAWLGRGDWGLSVTGGLGGAPCIAVGSAFTANQMSHGLSWLIDLNSTLGSFFFLLGGTAGVPGEGDGFAAVPLNNLPPSPTLAGTDFYFQAFVFDPVGPGLGGGISSTNGLIARLTMPPQIFVGYGAGGYSFVDPRTGTVTLSGSYPNLRNFIGGVYLNGGIDLYTTNSFGQMVHGDLRGSQPVWTSLTSSLGTTVAAWANLAYDPLTRWGWVAGRPGGGNQMEMEVVDLDPASATYGQFLAATSGMQQAISAFGAWAMSPDRTKIAAASPWTGSMAIVDVDTASSGFMQIAVVTPIPPSTVAPGFTVNNFIAWDPTGRRVYLARQNQGSNPGEVACYDMATGWVDWNPSTPFVVDHLGANSSSPVPLPIGLRSLAVSPDGGSLYVAGSGLHQGFAGRIDLNPQPSFTYATGTAVTSSAGRLALSPDGDTVAVAVTGELVLYDAATMTESARVPLGSGINVNDLVWQ